MAKSTVFTATQTGDNEVSILVETGYANSLNKYLKSKNVNCSQPSAAVFKTIHAYVDERGRKQINEQAVVHEIIMVGTIDDLNGWIEGWDPAL